MPMKAISNGCIMDNASVLRLESNLGDIFQGKIAFIEPFVQEKTRTIKLRVNADNKDRKLKPGMFVRATIKAVVGSGGKVYEQELAGKWICPMHPDVIKDRQMPCDICGMDLIRTREFGLADKPATEKKVLVIPKTAPLITGKRAVVYVEDPVRESSIYRYAGREVVLGPRTGDYYIVLSGLRAGEKVVTKGNFKIDSALQIEGKPSMMNPGGYYSEKQNALSQTAEGIMENAGVLMPAFPYYLAAANALSRDNPHEAAQNLELYLIFCPMVLEGKGNYWLQDSDAIKNPYFGPKMLKCGEIRGEYGRTIIKRQPRGVSQHNH